MWEFSTAGSVAGIAGGITLASVLEYFSLSWEVLAIFTALMILDFIFGIADAYMEDKQLITSAKMWGGLLRKSAKLIIPLTVALVLRGVGFDNLEMVITTIMSILIITEGYSIIWHVYSINTWEKLSEIDAFSLLVDFIVSIFKQKLPTTKDLEEKKPDVE